MRSADQQEAFEKQYISSNGQSQQPTVSGSKTLIFLGQLNRQCHAAAFRRGTQREESNSAREGDLRLDQSAIRSSTPAQAAVSLGT